MFPSEGTEGSLAPLAEGSSPRDGKCQNNTKESRLCQQVVATWALARGPWSHLNVAWVDQLLQGSKHSCLELMIPRTSGL